MKFSTALALGLAPLSLARKVRNSYPPIRRDPGLYARDGHLVNGKEEHVSEVDKGLNVDEHLLGGGDVAVDEMKGHGFTANSKTQVIIIWANPGAGAEKTTYNEKVTVTETVTAAPGSEATPPPAAASHTVTVGGPAGLIYQPDQLENVPVGDMVIFEFLAENHTVTQSGFDTPCEAMEGGMDTGHQPNPDNSVVPAPQVAMQVTTEEPLWFYCKTGNHCGSGMVFSINPTKEKTQAAFKEKAIAQNGEGEATPITGGEPPADGSGEGGGEQPPATPPAEEAPVETPPAEEAPVETPPAEGGQDDGGEGATPGQGTIGQDGSCSCVVSCSAGGFPAADAQGLGATGGYSGSLPIRMAGLK